ncbi:MAG: hypothetical protein PHG16_03760 [Lachnospiraceae bacterium]|nr:hypothetical protein [Lachnospiraceae bacterium]
MDTYQILTLLFLGGTFLIALLADRKTYKQFIERRTNPQNRGAKIILFSTPKLVQHMFQEGTRISKDEMAKLISQGASGNIIIMGITAFDLKVDERISMTSNELVRKIMEPNGINIVF